MEIRQAASLHPDPEGQDRRRDRRHRHLAGRARQAACVRRHLLLAPVPRAAPAAARVAAAWRRGAADRRDRQVGPGVRGVPAGDPVGLPGDHPGDRQRARGADADRAADLEQHARSGRCAEAALPASAYRLSGCEAGGPHHRIARAGDGEEPAARTGGVRAAVAHAGPEEAAVGQRDDRLGACAGAAARGGARHRAGARHAERAAEVRGGHRGGEQADRQPDAEGAAGGRSCRSDAAGRASRSASSSRPPAASASASPPPRASTPRARCRWSATRIAPS